jgi:hypothetical protein
MLKKSRGEVFLKNGDVKILLNLISLEIFKVCGINLFFKYLYIQFGELSLTEKKANSTQSFKSGFDK